MPITALPTPAPARTMTQAAFDAAYAAHIAALPTMVTEMNALAALMNATGGYGAIAIPYTFSTTTTDADPGNGILRLSSATQNASTVIRADLLGSDTKDYTTILDVFDDGAGTIKGYIKLVHATDNTKWLIFSITSMATPSGYRNITVTNIGSSAASPFANSDAIIMAFVPVTTITASVGDHEVVVHTGNGAGSTNTKIRRFSTTMINTGTAITYADSATLGASFTINETGLYSIYHSDGNAAANARLGISLNSAALTTSIDSIAIANRLCMTPPTAGSYGFPISITRRFTAGDVIRPHFGIAPDLTTDVCIFRIVKVGN